MLRRLLFGATLVVSIGVGCGGSESGEVVATTSGSGASTSTAAEATAAVTGRVVLRTSKNLTSPLDGVTVVLTSASGGDPASSETDDSGRFSVEVPAGEYTLTLEGLPEGQAADDVEVSVPGSGVSVGTITVTGAA